jgi:hypothetical protein
MAPFIQHVQNIAMATALISPFNCSELHEQMSVNISYLVNLCDMKSWSLKIGFNLGVTYPPVPPPLL